MSDLGGLCVTSLLAARDTEDEQKIQIWGCEMHGQNIAGSSFSKLYPDYNGHIVAPFIVYTDNTLEFSEVDHSETQPLSNENGQSVEHTVYNNEHVKLAEPVADQNEDNTLEFSEVDHSETQPLSNENSQSVEHAAYKDEHAKLAEPVANQNEPVQQGEATSTLACGEHEQDIPLNTEEAAEADCPLTGVAKPFTSSSSVQSIEGPAFNPAPFPSQDVNELPQLIDSFPLLFHNKDFWAGINPFTIHQGKKVDDSPYDSAFGNKIYPTSNSATNSFHVDAGGSSLQSNPSINMHAYNTDLSHTGSGFYGSNSPRNCPSFNSTSSSLYAHTVALSSSMSGLGCDYSKGNLQPADINPSPAPLGGSGDHAVQPPSDEQADVSCFTSLTPSGKRPGQSDVEVIINCEEQQASSSFAHPFNPADDTSTTLPKNLILNETYSAIHDPTLPNSGINNKNSDPGKGSGGKQLKKGSRKQVNEEEATNYKRVRMPSVKRDKSGMECAGVEISPTAQSVAETALVSTQSGCVVKPTAQVQGF
ncbi:hypothetical protein GYMLUDRAFT_252049 [Collybiopsis luxurians FD-317 M1]|uniref:Uncharacterized protein n=1 Tax=Collybiopsis luxurians FD-317 M1 TaxID=944289 RepID=A0A0D0C151_9AGAR|nr:hypothetical protein GYMLUDRAFT_252049 [Collybiopsis luxurians FD-317 M1]